MAIWFTADTHFRHRNIIRYCNRPFSSVEDHDNALIENWNRVVTKSDTVYHLGDVGKGRSDQIAPILNRLNGKIVLIVGNHDKDSLKEPTRKRFKALYDNHLLKVKFRGEDVTLFLSHYPHRSWNLAYHGCIHLFGHTHGTLPPHGRSFDVGVDVWNFTPVSLAQVVTKAQTTTPPGWISVNAELPQRPGEYLVWAGSNQVDTWDGLWKRWRCLVTHWMPLPEMPKK